MTELIKGDEEVPVEWTVDGPVAGVECARVEGVDVVSVGRDVLTELVIGDCECGINSLEGASGMRVGRIDCGPPADIMVVGIRDVVEVCSRSSVSV